MSAIGSGYFQYYVRIDKRVYPTFSKNKLPNSLKLFCSDYIFSKTIASLASSLKNIISNNRIVDLTWDITVQPQSLLERINICTKACKLEFDTNSECQLAGLDGLERLEQLHWARDLAVAHFKNPVVFQSDMTQEAVDEWQNKSLDAATDCIENAVGFEYFVKQVSFTREHLRTFAIDKAEITQDPKQLSCVAYALLNMDEIRAKEMIFKKEHAHKLTDILGLLYDWGYYPASDPEAGDFIVYIDENLDFQHLAILFGDQLALSKLGNNSPGSRIHKIDDVPLTYGKKRIFLRNIWL